jgi:hypothetical protein
VNVQSADGTEMLVDTLQALERSVVMLRTETSKVRADTKDELEGIDSKVQRLESQAGLLQMYKSASGIPDDVIRMDEPYV